MTTRRNFLKIASLVGGATILAACAPQATRTIALTEAGPVPTEAPPEPVQTNNKGDETMNKLDVIARMQVRTGKLDGFKKQAAEIIKQVKEKDTGTLRYDWFLSNDTDAWILEAYVSSDAWIEHRKNVGEALDVLFSEYADNHNVLVFGEPSPELFEMGNRLMAGRIKWFSFLNGLKS